MLTHIWRLVVEVAVPDWQRACETYTNLGFQLDLESDAATARNPDDVLRLEQVPDGVRPGLRWIDVASEVVAGDLAAMRERGIDVSQASTHESAAGIATLGPTNALPLRFVQLDSSSLNQSVEHPNGVSRLDRVYVVVDDLPTHADLFARVLGMPVPRIQRGAVIKADMAVFDIGPTGFAVTTPVAGGPAADALRGRGPGPFQALYRTRSMNAATDWMVAHGLPAPARAVRNNGEAAILVHREQACDMYLALVGPE